MIHGIDALILSREEVEKIVNYFQIKSAEDLKHLQDCDLLGIYEMFRSFLNFNDEIYRNLFK